MNDLIASTANLTSEFFESHSKSSLFSRFSVQDILVDRRNMGNILDLTSSKSWLVPCQDPPDKGSHIFKLAENICQ